MTFENFSFWYLATWVALCTYAWLACVSENQKPYETLFSSLMVFIIAGLIPILIMKACIKWVI